MRAPLKISVCSLFLIVWPLILQADSPRIEKPFTQESATKTDYSDRTSIRIATWNIEWFPAGLRQSTKENVQWQTAAVAAMIKDFKPDILLTQETRNLAALVSLNKNLGTSAFHNIASSWFNDENQERLLNDKIQQQVGILSNPAWSETWEIDFATLAEKDRPARGWLAARYEVGNLKFVIYNGHTKSNFGAENEKDRSSNYAKRLAAIQELKRDLDRLNLDPYRDKILVCGDFNTDFFSKNFEDEKTFSELQSMGFRHSFGIQERKAIITIPAREGEPYPDSTFDYIWFSSGWGENIPTAYVLARGASKRKDVFGGDERGLASDHYPVYVDIPLRSQP
ncbi:MAG: endonuclease/exonuclease/phosphatase family protein [Blastochloris sp.]|nr:endonuclease/exonuclease/phosphatase family protein [Blastochloris sp.]